MDSTLRKEQCKLYNKFRKFGELELDIPESKMEMNPHINVDENWKKNWKKCGDFGVFKLNVPSEYGGQGLNTESTVIALEALGQGCPDNGLTLAIGGQIWAVQHPVMKFGTPEQKERYLPHLASGECVGAYGLTEEGSGSNALALTTTAKKQDGGYILNGSKTLIGMAPACDLAIIFASTTPEHKGWGISAFLVEATDSGFIRGAPEHKMGLQSTPFGQLTFNDCWIPENRRLGKEGAGASIFQNTMEWERRFILSSHVGSMARQLDVCVAFARSRSSQGIPIIEHQSVSNRLADMKVRLETSRLLLHHAARLVDIGEFSLMDAAVVKLHLSESFVASSLDAVRIHGGKGYLSEFNIERDLRDAIGGVIYSGTSDIQRQVIARLL